MVIVVGDGLRLFLRAGVFLVLTSLLVSLVAAESAEFVVSGLSLVVGLLGLSRLAQLWGRW